MTEHEPYTSHTEQDPLNYTELVNGMRAEGYSEDLVSKLVTHYSENDDFAGAVKAYKALMETKRELRRANKHEIQDNQTRDSLGRAALEDIPSSVHAYKESPVLDRGSSSGDLRESSKPKVNVAPPIQSNEALPAGISPEELRERIRQHLKQ